MAKPPEGGSRKLTAEQRLLILDMFGPGVGVSVPRRLFPTIGRRELEGLVARYRAVYRKRGTLLHQLKWTNDGSVWAMDFTQPPTPTDATYPQVLVVRDLGPGALLLSLPVREASAEVVCDALRSLFVGHDPPLVLKSDNGSAFVVARTQRLLEEHGVLPLRSPPGTPKYARRAVDAAAAVGRPKPLARARRSADKGGT